MATLSASSLSSGSEDVSPPEKNRRTESGDGDKDVGEEEEDLVFYTDNDSIPDDVFDEYNKQVAESEGFEVDDFSEYPMFGSIRPMPLTDYFLERLIPYTVLAIKDFNEKEDANIEFVRVLKVNSGGGCGINYYITFEGKDAADGQTKTFQAKFFCGIDEDEVIFCRLKPPPTKQGVEEKSGVDDITIVCRC